MFSIFPVLPGGRFKNLDRFLVVWSSLSDPRCQSLPANVSDKIVKAIKQSAADDAFDYSICGIRKAEQESAVRRLEESVGNNPEELAERPLHEVISEVIRGIFFFDSLTRPIQR